MSEEKKVVTVGIPAGPNAYKTLKRLYCSLMTQTQVDKLKVMICLDGPECNKKDFTAITNQFSEIPTEIVRNEVNLGPGGCCDTIMKACDTPWITFMDSDDIFYDELSLEILLNSLEQNVVMVESIFAGESRMEDVQRSGGQIPRLRPYKNHGFSPWRFGRLINVEFCKQNEIKSTNLRTMEDSCLIKQIHMLTDGTQLKVKGIENLTYVWKENLYSITRTGIDDNEFKNKEKNEPWYNRFICPYGAVLSSINAVRNIKHKNPFNSNINRHIVDMMVNSYFTFIENSNRDERTADINFFNALMTYYELYKYVENDIDEKILNDIYSQHMVSSAQSLVGIVPQVTFPQFMDMIHKAPYGGNDQFKDIVAKFPEECVKGCANSGVLNIEEGVEQWILPDHKDKLKLHPNVNWADYKAWLKEQQEKKEAEEAPTEEAPTEEAEVIEFPKE